MDIADGIEGKIPANEKEYNRDVKNVTIEVLEDTITNKSLDIVITDNNEDYFGWGVDFKIQKKVNGKWEDLKFKSDDLVWIALAYLTNQDNKPVKGYEGAIPVLSAFSLDNSGKIIYTGTIDKNNLKDLPAPLDFFW